MAIKHHDFFQVYHPKNVAIEGDKKSFANMIMEEAYLYSNGELTPDYKPDDDCRNPLDIILYPSLVYYAQKIYKTEAEQKNYIDDIIDTEFSKTLLRIKPIYRITEFIEYHFNNYNGDKRVFLKHIKYVISPLIEKIIDENKTKKNVLIKAEYTQYSDISEIIKSWILEKENKPENHIVEAKIETNIGHADTIVINNNSTIGKQHNFKKILRDNKKSIEIISFLISVIMLIIAIATYCKTYF